MLTLGRDLFDQFDVLLLVGIRHLCEVRGLSGEHVRSPLLLVTGSFEQQDVVVEVSGLGSCQPEPPDELGFPGSGRLRRRTNGWCRKG